MLRSAANPDRDDPRILESWKRQEAIFSTAHLVILASVLLVHTLFASHFGLPSKPLIGILVGAFSIRILQLGYIQGLTQRLSGRTSILLTSASVLLNLGLAFAAALLTDRSDAQYFVLLVMPVVEAAFRFRLPVIVSVVGLSSALNFLWIAVYVSRHGGVSPNEYFEAGSISMIYAFMGVLMWMLVSTLQASESELAQSVFVLRATQEQLLQEEKLAAVGRLSSAIAHEVRNPVAMISSSLKTALQSRISAEERAQMFEIAAIQSSRLEKLTNDFLSYARPRKAVLSSGNMCDLLSYLASTAKAHAAKRDVQIRIISPSELLCEFDPLLTQQALLNLVINAIDASPPQCTILLSAESTGDKVSIRVENRGTPISKEALDHVFEPFYTTKPEGCGLGLAIARNAARAMGGDLRLSCNQSNMIAFTLDLPIACTSGKEAAHV